MSEAWMSWLLLVGIGIGVAIVWLVLPRAAQGHADDPGDPGGDEAYRRREAAWISRVIGSRGGVAPQALVEEILDLHAVCLEDPAVLKDTGAPRGSDLETWRR